MNGNKFEELQPTPFILFGANKERLVFGCFNGGLQLAIFKPNANRPDSYKISPDMITEILSELQTIMRAQAGTKSYLSQDQWDVDQKKYIPSYALTFHKDDSQVYSLEVQSPGKDPIIAVIKAGGGISRGSEPLSDADKSASKMKTMFKWFDSYVPILKIFTKKKFVNNGGYQKPQQQQPKPQESSSSVSNDIFDH